MSPPLLRTERLVLRRPTAADAAAVFAYAGDPEVTRYMGWPLHRTIADTQAFLQFAINEWDRNDTGTYLIEHDGQVIGSTGFHLDSPHHAGTGYILVRAAWGRGYATEACRAMVALAPSLGISRLYAYCHADHAASARVLDKAGLTFEGVIRHHTIFPNLAPDPQDVRSYAWTS